MWVSASSSRTHSPQELVCSCSTSDDPLLSSSGGPEVVSPWSPFSLKDPEPAAEESPEPSLEAKRDHFCPCLGVPGVLLGQKEEAAQWRGDQSGGWHDSPGRGQRGVNTTGWKHMSALLEILCVHWFKSQVWHPYPTGYYIYPYFKDEKTEAQGG